MDLSNHLAQINVARFRLPMADPANADFVAALDSVNASADGSPGFLWRLIGDGGNATDLRAFEDPHMLINMSVWESLAQLGAFTYRDPLHLRIMRRRKEWFERMEFFLALWWIPAGHRPTVAEGKARLDLLRRRGPTADAFTFATPFGPPGSGAVEPVLDECA